MASCGFPPRCQTMAPSLFAGTSECESPSPNEVFVVANASGA